MAQTDVPPWSPASSGHNNSGGTPQSLWRRLFGKDKDSKESSRDHGGVVEGAVAGVAGDGAANSKTPQQGGAGEDLDSNNGSSRAGLIRRVSRKVVPGLPRAQTFKRQQSELRNNLEAVQPTPAERRTVSMDRRMHASSVSGSQTQSNPRTSAPDFLATSFSAAPSVPSIASMPSSPLDEKMLGSISELDGPIPIPIPVIKTEVVPDAPLDIEKEEPPPPPPPTTTTTEEVVRGEVEEIEDEKHEVEEEHHVPPPVDFPPPSDTHSIADNLSITTSQYDAMIREELEQTWILNLSMHFRDKSKREKFFVTYRQHSTLWRRVTISLDYRDAPDNSLEMELTRTKFQRDKSAKIYEAIRESLGDIQFYDTVTNLKLQTTDGRLHVHVVEDVNEIVHYPTVRMIQHMRCRRVKEREIEFDSHMSGFVYKVRVHGQVLIKKEIPGPDTVDEFLYEINALNRLRASRNVIEFYGVIVDDQEEHVKGLLISYAEKGALIDIIYDHRDDDLPWDVREKWARQIVEGLSEIHEAGFVQGDFTLSNIVIDENDDAKIIDINRRGCPVGWEPPEATPLIESGQRISMYIGVKSDLYQLGMVLWALATMEDEPEAFGRPLRIDTETPDVPPWYRYIVDICLSNDPRGRKEASYLLSIFPPDKPQDKKFQGINNHSQAPSISVDDGYIHTTEFPYDFGMLNGVGGPVMGPGSPLVRTIQPPNDWSYVTWGPSAMSEDYFYPPRGRSPPSPLPSSQGGYGARFDPRRMPAWSDHEAITAPSISDVLPEEAEGAAESYRGRGRSMRRSVTPVTNLRYFDLGTGGPALEREGGAKFSRDDSGKVFLGHDVRHDEYESGEDEACLMAPELADELGGRLGLGSTRQLEVAAQITAMISTDAEPVASGADEDVEEIVLEAEQHLATEQHDPSLGGLHAEESGDTGPGSQTHGGSSAATEKAHTETQKQDQTAPENAASERDGGKDVELDLEHAPPMGGNETWSPEVPSALPTAVLSKEPSFFAPQDSFPDALVGVGSAYDHASDNRQGEINEDDFGATEILEIDIVAETLVETKAEIAVPAVEDEPLSALKSTDADVIPEAEAVVAQEESTTEVVPPQAVTTEAA